MSHREEPTSFPQTDAQSRQEEYVAPAIFEIGSTAKVVQGYYQYNPNDQYQGYYVYRS